MSLLFKESQQPIRTLSDIEAMEQTPLSERMWSMDVNAWLDKGMKAFPNKNAITFVPSGNPDQQQVVLTYQELHSKSCQVANLFHSLGVTSKDAVLYLLPTTPDHYVVMLAGLATGIACCINWMLKPAQLIELIKSSKAQVIVAMGPTPGFDIWEKIESIRSDIPSSVHVLSLKALAETNKTNNDLYEMAKSYSNTQLDFKREVQPDDVAAYIHSGGTTGSPKLVQLTHRGFSYKCWANSIVMGHTPDDVIFSDYPMFHIAGFFGRGVLALSGGMSIVIPSAIGARDKNFMANYWKFIDRFKITILSGVPTTLSVLSKNPPTTENISSLRPYMCTGSTSLPVEVAKTIERITGVRVLLTYGATEYTQNIAQGPRDGDPKYGSAGLRLPYSQFKTVITDAEGVIQRECKIDEIGTVFILGPSVTTGYVDPIYNDGIFSKDGWFNSGDLGRIDSDGYLWLTGRAKDVIIRGGHNIDPSIIEETLRTHPDVVLVAAVSKPDAHSGELPVAYVQLTTASKATSAQLVDFAKEHITEQAAAPKDVYILETMPLTDVGKPHKTQLRLDSSKRAFTDLMQQTLPANTSIEVTVQQHPTHGAMVSYKLRAVASKDQSDLENAIKTAMKAFASQFEIIWN